MWFITRLILTNFNWKPLSSICNLGLIIIILCTYRTSWYFIFTKLRPIWNIESSIWNTLVCNCIALKWHRTKWSEVRLLSHNRDMIIDIFFFLKAISNKPLYIFVNTFVDLLLTIYLISNIPYGLLSIWQRNLQ